MGFDKATMVVEGRVSAVRLAAALTAVARPVLEVGPGRSGLASVSEDPPGSGPLVAIAAGWRALTERGHGGPVLVLACDLPLVDEEVLRLLAGWPGPASVVPVVAGRDQPLCARWSAADLAA
ncbi:MAG TPA: NTP transferase domain-containing protein, partial [Acidimicrobiales bacterium]|nr:NTP transferase domain-containing protein [Acidimicrobiales bacterium]